MEEAEDNRVAGRKWQWDESSVVSALLTINKVHKEYDEAVSGCTDILADTAIQYVVSYIVVWYIDIAGYIHRELLSNNSAVNLFRMITKYCTTVRYSKINWCYNLLINGYNCIDATTLNKLWNNVIGVCKSISDNFFSIPLFLTFYTLCLYYVLY